MAKSTEELNNTRDLAEKILLALMSNSKYGFPREHSAHIRTCKYAFELAEAFEQTAGIIEREQWRR